MSDPEHSAMPAERQRRAQRKNVFILVQLVGDFGDTTVKLRDLSNLGARLDCPIALNLGDTLTLTRGTYPCQPASAGCGGRASGWSSLKPPRPKR
ncbi:MAG: PilZ domain-containing protein [Sphingosinicella sp.]|uniref:PilZ domain-containing protein n=1 Tax=Sphingosinicella sp. TaxID=1917971 RepID=UPI004037CEAF